MQAGATPAARVGATAWAAGCLLLAVVGLGAPAFAQASDAEAIRRGEYIFQAGGCGGCHTDVKNNGPPFAGRRAMKTPFGTFYSPNITPDLEHGIGRWSEADFIRALRAGVRPDGAHYFPAFPYTSFTRIADADLKDLKAYIFSLPPVAQSNRPHDVGFPFHLRFLQFFWKWLFFTPGPLRPQPAKSAESNRGAYLVEALGHCGECHTPRNFLGGMTASLAFAGTRTGPEGEKIPNITPDPDTGIGQWSPGDLTDLFKMGMKVDGDFVAGGMAEVVRNTTSKLTDADLKAMIAYLRALPPIRNDVQSKPR
ncbi:MAG: c-type cytochrome [Pseudomonadota bacterium]